MPETDAMIWLEALLSIAVCTTLLLLGLQLLHGRYENRVARLHVLSSGSLDRVNAPALCHFAGQLTLTVDGLLSITLVGGIFDWIFVTLAGAVLTLITSVGGITYMNTHARFRK